MSAYFYKAKTQILVGLTYRFEVFATLLTKYIQIVATVFLWQCVYASKSSIKGMSEQQMITWTIMAAGLSIIFTTQVQNNIRRGVVKGDIAVELIRPCNLMGMYFAQDFGSMVVNLIMRFVPTVFLGGITFSIMLPPNKENFILCLISVVAGYVITWLLFAITGAFAFWAMELGNLTWTVSTLISILSGNLVPLYFFPESIQRVLAWLPFQYTYQTPLSLYIGKITWEQGIEQIGIQLLWIIVLFGVLSFLWSKIKNNILVQGG